MTTQPVLRIQLYLGTNTPKCQPFIWVFNSFSLSVMGEKHESRKGSTGMELCSSRPKIFQCISWVFHGSNRSHASLQRFSSANLLRFIYWNSTPWRFQDKLDSSPSPLHEKSLGVSKHVNHGFRYLNFVPSPSSCIVGTLDSWKKNGQCFSPCISTILIPPEGQLPTSTSSACCGNEAESIWVNQHLTTAYHMTWSKLAGS